MNNEKPSPVGPNNISASTHEIGLYASSALEQSPAQESENILHQLVEIRDHKRDFGDFLVESLLTNRHGLVVMGEPGNGKTTITNQLKDALEKQALLKGMNVEVILHRYDEFLAQKEEALGRRELWMPEDWQEFNDYMYQQYVQALEEGDMVDGVRKVHILEVPAVGSDEERDRGIRASRKLFERAEGQEEPDTHFVFVTINTLLQQKSGFLRRAVVDPSLPDGEVVSLLAQHNQVIIGDVSDEEKGKRVKALFKKSAQPEHIATIRKEAAEEIAVWEEAYNKTMFANAVRENPNASRDAHNYDVLVQRMKGMRTPNWVTDEKVREVYAKYNAEVDSSFFQVKASTVIDAAMRQAVYVENLLHYDYKLDEDTALIVHNPYDSSSVITIDVEEGHREAA
jgi:hypothetical protein